jgi:hypothetical protein
MSRLLLALVRPEIPCVVGVDSFGADVAIPLISVELSLEVGHELGRWGSPLRSLKDDVVPAIMNEGAANTAGAHYKSAFWLARGSRVSRYWSGQQEASSEYFRQKARELWAKAGSEKTSGDLLASLAYNPVSVLIPVSQSKESIRQIFEEAARFALNSSPSNELSLLLQRLGTPESTEARQQKVAIEQGFVLASPTVAGRIWQRADKTLQFSWVGNQLKDAVVMVYDQFVRPATAAEVEKAKRSVDLYANTAENTIKLEQMMASGVPFTAEEVQEVEKNKNYLSTLAQPMNELRKSLKMPPIVGPGPAPGSSSSFGVAPVAAAAVGVPAGTVILVVGVVLAIIVIAGLLAWSAERDFQTKKLFEDKLKDLAACVSDPSLPKEQRAKCTKLSEALLGTQDYSSMLWGAAALVGLGVGAYAFGPAIKAAATTGASELERWNLERAERAKLGKTSAQVSSAGLLPG